MASAVLEGRGVAVGWDSGGREPKAEAEAVEDEDDDWAWVASVRAWRTRAAVSVDGEEAYLECGLTWCR